MSDMQLENISFEEFMGIKYHRGGVLVNLPQRKLTDEEIEDIWDHLGDIPIDEDECLDDNYFIWTKGSDKYEDVWRWFDSNHSKGVAYLVNDYKGKN
ncbi:hypothetical protein [Alkaliphilus sp. B6464]|uniref:hypothetical protein n=1 Tax=Alkaliphilus sp. B6464 TaxID=2731219 RepID=UPI001BA480F3|nr:hypothetical protein [Alkaliphilus sp. B6464]QUH21775.1 hypothetical protein HYG84_17720 [Alkaliphilus sp. B6464]